MHYEQMLLGRALTAGTITATAFIALFIFSNWAYVRDRLLSATVEYEETGWYDGQVYVKDPEMLARAGPR
jgi:hypothetical protein